MVGWWGAEENGLLAGGKRLSALCGAEQQEVILGGVNGGWGPVEQVYWLGVARGVGRKK